MMTFGKYSALASLLGAMTVCFWLLRSVYSTWTLMSFLDWMDLPSFVVGATPLNTYLPLLSVTVVTMDPSMFFIGMYPDWLSAFCRRVTTAPSTGLPSLVITVPLTV